MKYSLLFALISLAAVAQAAISPWLAWSLLYCAVGVAFAVVSLAYALRTPGLLMKRVDGSQRIISWLVLWPYLLLVRLTFALYLRLKPPVPAYAEAAPNLWFGRRLTAREARTSMPAWNSVLDLAAEFPRLRIEVQTYSSLPLLDALPVDPQQLQAAVAWIDQHLLHGPLFIHCALGHGRTGSVVLAWLLTHGDLRDVDSALSHLKSLRSSLDLSHRQLAAVGEYLRIQMDSRTAKQHQQD